MNKEFATGVLGNILSEMNEESLAKTRNRMLVAVKISDALKARGLSQKQFAKMMGKTESEVSEWLSGDRNFTIDTLTAIELALKIKLLNTYVAKYSFSAEVQPSKIVPLHYGSQKRYRVAAMNQTDCFTRACANFNYV